MRAEPIQKRWNEAIATLLRDCWAEHGTRLIRAAIAIMTLAALVWLSYQFWRLLLASAPIWQTSPKGAVDLNLRYAEVQRWFSGVPVYGAMPAAVYPPASYAMFWPLLGWLDLPEARCLWAATTVGALAWLVYLVVRESSADRPLERVLTALMPLSVYATGAAIGNGQLIVHVIPVLLAGILLVRDSKAGWRKDLAAATLLILALVKPTISAPFFWMVLFVPGRLRPNLLIYMGYGALTLLAASFQKVGPLVLLQAWAEQTSRVNFWAGHVNVHAWLFVLGLGDWMTLVSLLILLALGAWTYSYRHADLWVMLGVTALVARFWAHHAWYDDVLILFPMIALFRIAKQSSQADTSATAGLLLAATIASMLAPGGLYLLPSPWNAIYVFGQTIIWVGTLIFLLGQARKAKLVMATPAGAKGVTANEISPAYVSQA